MPSESEGGPADERHRHSGEISGIMTTGWHGMGIRENDVLHLPDLAAGLGLTSPQFTATAILRGGMGECIRITQGQQAFALKVIQSQLLIEADAWERYRREVKIWATVSACEGVVEVLGIVRVHDLPAVCSRWMSGGNLRRYLRNRSPEFFYSAMSRVIGTLRWASVRYGVIHRDIKPDNILLDEEGRAHVSDWGLARPIVLDEHRNKRAPDERGAPATLTAAGSFLGTVCYASPEQLMGERSLDHRTDIYSLGCLMYEWETGACPFTGVTLEEIQQGHLFQAPAPIGGLSRQTAFGAEKVILACLEKAPEQRPGDYSELDAALAESARARGVRYQAFEPATRYPMPMVGGGEYDRFLEARPGEIKDKNESYAVREMDELGPFLREAEALSAIGDFAGAERIYGSLFVAEAVRAMPDAPHHQFVTVNYANCLLARGRFIEARSVLRCLAGAAQKPAAYFVNLSLAEIKLLSHAAATETAQAGLRVHPDDPELMGNLLIAQTAMGDFERATETAKERLRVKRDVHSLQEVAGLHCQYARAVRELDWPLAVKLLTHAVRLLREAKDANPRYLPARLQLTIALNDLTAFEQCLDEIGETKDLPVHADDRIFLASICAECLDGAGAHERCWKFCDSWLEKIAKRGEPSSVATSHVVNLERTRAMTIADGYCIGRLKAGHRVIAPEAIEFFDRIVLAPHLRKPRDFCYLARLHEWQEEFDRAEAVLRQGEALYPDYWELPFNRATFGWRSGDNHGALPHAKKAADLAPWRPQAWHLLKRIFERLGRLADAENAGKRAAEIQRIREELAVEIERL